MAAKKKEIQLQVLISNQEQWDELMALRGLIVTDVYPAWCGPCKAVMSLFRKIKNELGDDLLHFAAAEADGVEALEKYRGKCEPTFLFYAGGELVDVVRGANAPVLQRKILAQLQAEKRVLDEGGERLVVQDTALQSMEDNDSDMKTPRGQQDQEEEEGEEALTSHPYTVALIKPDVVAKGKVEEIIMKVQEAGFEIVAHEERTLLPEEARDFYQHRSGEPNFAELVQFMSSGPCHVLMLSRPDGADDVIPAWRELIGPTDLEVAKAEKPDCLRAQYGTDTTLNALHGSSSQEQASRELAFFFPNLRGSLGERAEPEDGRRSWGDRAASGTPRGDSRQGSRVERTLALIRPDLLKEKKDAVLGAIKEAGFHIAMQKEVILTEEQAREFYREHEGQDYFSTLVKHMTSGPVLALALARKDAVQGWRDTLGPKDLQVAKEAAPQSLRAQFVSDAAPINQLHGSASPTEAKKELDFFFPKQQTLAVIKPDVLPQHKEEIMSTIRDAGFTVSMMREVELSQELASEFYHEHRDKAFFPQLVDLMSRGPSLMLVLNREDAVEEWRRLMGPTDPDVARKTAPESLRARFARSVFENALHGASNLHHAQENIHLLFGDISFSPDGTVLGMEPDLDKVEPPEYRDDTEEDSTEKQDGERAIEKDAVDGHTHENAEDITQEENKVYGEKEREEALKKDGEEKERAISREGNESIRSGDDSGRDGAAELKRVGTGNRKDDKDMNAEEGRVGDVDGDEDKKEEQKQLHTESSAEPPTGNAEEPETASQGGP
ncbi:LOW QUALITY PROTEIN: thioredoxin domain-containing protein 6-like [Lethenteron reissneri]|uniref:LOW QUALITY PROTEIN: thioredoxin domain-containing protein 6-like n=1 Tax=Lethenteron reissneri TaxID=7753 RepID=UPI002AB78689|nr:LOW QUALITY PROTEIN: thioredoxin domain-containing protein 6-like [Lethenteron reissneri]